MSIGPGQPFRLRKMERLFAWTESFRQGAGVRERVFWLYN